MSEKEESAVPEYILIVDEGAAVLRKAEELGMTGWEKCLKDLYKPAPPEYLRGKARMLPRASGTTVSGRFVVSRPDITGRI